MSTDRMGMRVGGTREDVRRRSYAFACASGGLSAYSFITRGRRYSTVYHATAPPGATSAGAATSKVWPKRLWPGIWAPEIALCPNVITPCGLCHRGSYAV